MLSRLVAIFLADNFFSQEGSALLRVVQDHGKMFSLKSLATFGSE